MLTWLRGLLEKPPDLRELIHRVENLEDDVQYLSERFDKLKGRQTGGIRSQKPSGSTNGEQPIPDTATPSQRAFLEHLDPISRKIHLQRMGLLR